MQSFLKILMTACLAVWLWTQCGSAQLQEVGGGPGSTGVEGEAVEHASTPLFLDEEGRFDFAVEEAFFLVIFGKRAPLKYKAEILPPSSGEKPRWRFAAAVQPPAGADAVDFTVFVKGSAGRYGFLPAERRELPGQKPFLASIDALRRYVLERKQDLGSWQVQSDAQEESISRLRGDAAVIGELGRIAEIAEEGELLKEEVSNLAKDMENTRRLVKLAAQGQRPKNLESRQAVLTKQLDELALAVHSVESGEMSRKFASEEELQHKLGVIEAARGEDFDALQNDLLRLRQIREELEKGLTGKAAGGEDEYQLPVN